MEVTKLPISTSANARANTKHRQSTGPTATIVMAMRTGKINPIQHPNQDTRAGSSRDGIDDYYRQISLTFGLAKRYIAEDPANRLPMLEAGKLKDLSGLLGLDAKTIAELWDKEGDDIYSRTVLARRTKNGEETLRRPRFVLSKAAPAKEQPCRQPNGPQCDAGPGFTAVCKGSAGCAAAVEKESKQAVGGSTKPAANEIQIKEGKTSGVMPAQTVAKSDDANDKKKDEVATAEDELDMSDIVVLGEISCSASESMLSDDDWVVLGDCGY